jgi:ATP-dependent Zn protease
MDIVSILINCLPVVLLIGVWIFFMGRMKKGVPTTNSYMVAHLEETQRTNALLERIAVALEARRDA